MSADEIKHLSQWKAYDAVPVVVQWDCEAQAAHTDELELPSLLVRTNYEMDIDLRRPIREQVVTGESRACGHVAKDERAPMLELLQMIQAYHEAGVETGKDRTSSSSSRYYQCRRFPTDMEVTIDKNPGEALLCLR